MRIRVSHNSRLSGALTTSSIFGVGFLLYAALNPIYHSTTIDPFFGLGGACTLGFVTGFIFRLNRLAVRGIRAFPMFRLNRLAVKAIQVFPKHPVRWIIGCILVCLTILFLFGWSPLLLLLTAMRFTAIGAYWFVILLLIEQAIDKEPALRLRIKDNLDTAKFQESLNIVAAITLLLLCSFLLGCQLFTALGFLFLSEGKDSIGLSSKLFSSNIANLLQGGPLLLLKISIDLFFLFIVISTFVVRYCLVRVVYGYEGGDRALQGVTQRCRATIKKMLGLFSLRVWGQQPAGLPWLIFRPRRYFEASHSMSIGSSLSLMVIGYLFFVWFRAVFAQSAFYNYPFGFVGATILEPFDLWIRALGYYFYDGLKYCTWILFAQCSGAVLVNRALEIVSRQKVKVSYSITVGIVIFNYIIFVAGQILSIILLQVFTKGYLPDPRLPISDAVTIIWGFNFLTWPIRSILTIGCLKSRYQISLFAVTIAWLGAPLVPIYEVAMHIFRGGKRQKDTHVEEEVRS
jgi:hypothetical protein